MESFNINKLKLINIYFLSVLLWAISCRTTSENEKLNSEKITPNETQHVRVNLIGIAWDNNTETPQPPDYQSVTRRRGGG